MPLKHIALGDLMSPEIDARTQASEEKFGELVESIKNHGIIEPLVVRDIGESRYEIVAGTRRYLAAKAAGHGKVPCLVRKLSTDEVLAIRLEENLIREDMNHVDIATYIDSIMNKFGLNQEDVAKKLGRTRAWVNQMLVLLKGDPLIKEMVKNEEIKYTTARELNRVPNQETRRRLAVHAGTSGCNTSTVKKWVNDELTMMDIKAKSFEQPVASDEPVVYKQHITVYPCSGCGAVGDVQAMHDYKMCPVCASVVHSGIQEGIFTGYGQPTEPPPADNGEGQGSGESASPNNSEASGETVGSETGS
jgi:ParB/RepB/Spo0J family partition protein